MRPGVLFAGNFLSAHGRKRSVCEELADRLESRGWPIIRTSSKITRPLRLIDMLAAVFSNRRRFRIAHIDVYSGPAFFWAESVSLALRALNRPYVLTLHGGALPEFAERWPGRVRRLVSAASAVTAPSKFLARRMAKYRPALVVPNALDGSRYSARVHPAISKPKLVWLRSFHRIYNPQMAIEVLSLLRGDFPDIALTMIGPDDGDGSFETARKLAIDLGLGGAVHFTGAIPKSEVPNWLGDATVFVNTTNIDNAPVSVLEAMACGLPIVSTNVGGIPDLIEDEHNGLLVPAGDARAMAARVRQVLESADLACRLSLHARQTASEHDWEQVLPRWEELLHLVAIAG